MTYVIGEPCIDVMDPACVEECPVDCVYEGGRRCTSTSTSASTVAPASRSARSRPSTTRTTCRRSGRATGRTTPGSSPKRCPAATSARLPRRCGQAGPAGGGHRTGRLPPEARRGEPTVTPAASRGRLVGRQPRPVRPAGCRRAGMADRRAGPGGSRTAAGLPARILGPGAGPRPGPAARRLAPASPTCDKDVRSARSALIPRDAVARTRGATARRVGRLGAVRRGAWGR